MLKHKAPRAAIAKRWRDFYLALGARPKDPEKPDELSEAVRLALEATAPVPASPLDPLPANQWEFAPRPDVAPFVIGDQHSVFEWVLAVFAGPDPRVYAASLGISLDKPEDEGARRSLLYHLAKDVFLHLEEEIKAGAVDVMRPAYRHDRVYSTERDHTRDVLSMEEVKKFAERGGYQEARRPISRGAQSGSSQRCGAIGHPPDTERHRRGPKPGKFDATYAKMQADLKEGRLTKEALGAMQEKALAFDYRVSRDTARKARNKVLGELTAPR
jgi:hypothetical protein